MAEADQVGQHRAIARMDQGGEVLLEVAVGACAGTAAMEEDHRQSRAAFEVMQLECRWGAGAVARTAAAYLLHMSQTRVPPRASNRLTKTIHMSHCRM